MSGNEMNVDPDTTIGSLAEHLANLHLTETALSGQSVEPTTHEPLTEVAELSSDDPREMQPADSAAVAQNVSDPEHALSHLESGSVEEGPVEERG